MIYIVNNENGTIVGKADTLYLADDVINTLGLTSYTFLQDLTMNYTSRVCFFDGRCVYNNKQFWAWESFLKFNDYEQHTVTDFMGNVVHKDAFINEAKNNCLRLQNVESIASQIQYNRIVGGEFIDLFREECIRVNLANFGLNEALVMNKVASIVGLLLSGCFDSAITMILNIERDGFFTNERLQRYADMLAIADIISYNV